MTDGTPRAEALVHPLYTTSVDYRTTATSCQITLLSTLRFVEERRNALFLGAGVGARGLEASR